MALGLVTNVKDGRALTRGVTNADIQERSPYVGCYGACVQREMQYGCWPRNPVVATILCVVMRWDPGYVQGAGVPAQRVYGSRKVSFRGRYDACVQRWGGIWLMGTSVHGLYDACMRQWDGIGAMAKRGTGTHRPRVLLSIMPSARWVYFTRTSICTGNRIETYGRLHPRATARVLVACCVMVSYTWVHAVESYLYVDARTHLPRVRL